MVCKFGKFTDTSSNTPKVLEVRFCILNIIGEQVYWLSLLNLYMFSLETAVKKLVRASLLQGGGNVKK